jgi:hypothetical protein
MKNQNLSNEAQNLSETAWYYEEETSIDLIVECKDADKFHRAIHVKIPYRKLLATLKRAGRL